jgi:hypothetical protein
MSFRRIRVIFTLALISSAQALSAQTVLPSAEGVASERPTSLVVLRNGEVLTGQIHAAKNDRVTVRMPRGEISVRQAEVDVIASTLDDAYARKLAKIPPTDIEAHLDLAAWCVRHGLFGNAAVELTTAISIQPRHPRIAMIQRHLQQSIEQHQTAAEPSTNPAEPSEPIVDGPTARSEPQEASSPESTVWPPRNASPHANKQAQGSPDVQSGHEKQSNATVPKRAQSRDTITEIERLVRTLPSEAVESFTSVAQPILVNGCATAGCHAPGNATTFTLLRLPSNRSVSRRLTQRNLYNVVQLVDFKKPADSVLFKMAKEPHGPLKTPALGEGQTVAFRELVQWVATLTRSNLDEILPPKTLEEKPAVVDARPTAGSARQSLMRRMRAPTVSTSRTQRAPIATPIEHARAIVGSPLASARLSETIAEPPGVLPVANESPLAPSRATVNQAGLVIGVPPASISAVGNPGVPPANDVQAPASANSGVQSAATIRTPGAPPSAPPVRTPNPNGITAVDRFLAIKGAPRLDKEVQAAPKLPAAAGNLGIKQQASPSEPDPYDLMRFVKER